MKLDYKILLINQKRNVRINNYIDKKIKIILVFLHFFYVLNVIPKNINRDEITLVSALFRMETPRHKFENYIKWVKNLLQINKPFIFYVDKNISSIIKENRPKEYENITIWVELNLSELFFYRHYRKKLEKTYLIDKAKYKHNVNLFIIWNEKVIFLRKSINKNYFNSKYFFWVDAGFFRDKNMTKYIDNWPSLKKFKKNPKVMLNEIRKIDKKEFYGLMKFDYSTHDKFMNECNMGGAFFGGRYDYLLKFVYFYF